MSSLFSARCEFASRRDCSNMAAMRWVDLCDDDGDDAILGPWANYPAQVSPLPDCEVICHGVLSITEPPADSIKEEVYLRASPPKLTKTRQLSQKEKKCAARRNKIWQVKRQVEEPGASFVQDERESVMPSEIETPHADGVKEILGAELYAEAVARVNL